jgi:hypothetical protein
MKHFGRLLAIGMLGVAVSMAVAAEEKTPDATLKLHTGSVAAGIGFSWAAEPSPTRARTTSSP